mmetsp:Transcript_46068/g.68623  ORF Transcript_46068/g.68623 Transcript_46068/m.68623 type:complete len:107 (-) Transcript_46068:123-443(-)|eukprot:CAMPEP_0194052684 /NCGR_PEP_ID=MMETSP0009_2-20130614/46536_1 /TAXON_ID=210454 /ORGANISM="Grammatophora oceanica, Strain CCMP 410" /LENGTH=106 /DNA_ID=CAMNT_0038700405 /DNA_START=95 /DNA_END=415 /DNA_ORIENTATION=+
MTADHREAAAALKLSAKRDTSMLNSRKREKNRTEAYQLRQEAKAERTRSIRDRWEQNKVSNSLYANNEKSRYGRRHCQQQQQVVTVSDDDPEASSSWGTLMCPCFG